MATLVVNKLRGILNVAAVKAPAGITAITSRRKSMLEDIAVLTGRRRDHKKTLGSRAGTKVEITPAWLPPRKFSIRPADSDNTTIIEGAGESKAIQGRIEQIRREISTTTSDYDREKLQERLAKLAGGVAQIARRRQRTS